MAVNFYLCEEFKFGQENKGFRYLCSSALEYLADGATIIGNISYGDGKRQLGQIDALVLRPSSIFIVDFKDVGGFVCVSEDGEWQTSDGFTISGGTTDKNPFQQVRRYKAALSSWLSKSTLLPRSNSLDHISGLVMFTQPMIVDASPMDPRTTKWFCAADQLGSMEFLRTQASPRLQLSADCMDQIAASLSAQPYALKPTELWVPSSAVNDAKQTGYFEAMRDVEDARQAAWWAENGDRIRAEHEEARRGWAIQDALAEIRRTMEALQHEPAIVDDLIAALSRTLWRKSAPLGAVVQRYQPLTSVDLTVVLQSWGIEPDDYP